MDCLCRQLERSQSIRFDPPEMHISVRARFLLVGHHSERQLPVIFPAGKKPQTLSLIRGQQARSHNTEVMLQVKIKAYLRTKAPIVFSEY